MFCAPGSTGEQEFTGRGIHRLENSWLAHGDHGLVALPPNSHRRQMYNVPS